MPRYDDRDRYGGTRLYIGHLPSRTRSRDLEDLFSRYGRVRNVDLKHDFAFVDFSDSRDADDARYNLDGRDFDGSRIVVEFARGAPRGRGGSREYLGRGPAPGSGCCFNCGVDGHWARDCTAGDWRNKCYRCGQRGHIERNCKSSPKSVSRRGRSYSRSPSPRRGRSYSRSYSRSRSPPRRGGRAIEREDRSRSPRRSRSPPPTKGPNRSTSPYGSRSPPLAKAHKRSSSPYGSRSPPRSKGPKQSLSPNRSRSPPPSKGRKRSPSPYGSRSPPPSKVQKRSPSPYGSRSPPPSKGRKRSPSPLQDGSDYGLSPRREKSRSPMSPKANGHSLSPGEDMNYPLRGSRSP